MSPESNLYREPTSKGVLNQKLYNAKPLGLKMSIAFEVYGFSLCFRELLYFTSNDATVIPVSFMHFDKFPRPA